MTEADLRARLAACLSRQVSLMEFCVWFLRESPAVGERDPPALRHLATGVRVLLDEYAGGERTGKELVRGLRKLHRGHPAAPPPGGGPDAS